METILACARMEAQIKELKRKRASDMNKFDSYASKRIIRNCRIETRLKARKYISLLNAIIRLIMKD